MKIVSLCVLMGLCVFSPCGGSVVVPGGKTAAVPRTPILFGGDFAAADFRNATNHTVVASPGGRFAYDLASEPISDTVDAKTRLWLIEKATGRRLLLGQNSRYMTVKWASTQIGDLLTVENDWDPNASEAYVVQPRVADGKLVCGTLYASPSQAPCGWNHSYAKINKVTPDGLMTVELSWWDDGRKGSGNRMTVVQPLFRGDAAARPAAPRNVRRGS